MGSLTSSHINCWPVFIHSFIHSFVHSFILEIFIANFQEITTQRHFQPSHEQCRRTSEGCKIWKGGPSARNAVHRGDQSMLMDPTPQKRPKAYPWAETWHRIWRGGKNISLNKFPE